MIYSIKDVHQKVVNVDALPHGLNCRYLRCLLSHHEEPTFIATQWHRKLPRTIAMGYVIVDFKPENQ